MYVCPYALRDQRTINYIGNSNYTPMYCGQSACL